MASIRKLTEAQKREITRGLVEAYLGIEDDPDDPEERRYYRQELKSMRIEVDKACQHVGI